MKTIYYLLFVLMFVGCTNENVDYDQINNGKVHHPADYVIEISTTRNKENFHDSFSHCSSLFSRSVDPFSAEREVVSNSCLILPELRSFIFPGNILTKSSVANANYKPLNRSNDKVSLFLSLPGTESETIEHISATKFNNYLNRQFKNASFKQNEDFQFSVEQFTSYNELKQVFGSNVNTSALFWGNSSASSSSSYEITKSTGLYLKFWQTSFVATMDIPDGIYGNIDSNMIDSAVYVNSVTYGRMGILTLETNYKYGEAENMIQNCFHTILSHGSSYLTKEEKDFLQGCDFKVMLLGGAGATAVQSFTGLSGFVDHIKNGMFSDSQPGVPISCTFANVADNSPANIIFKYNIKLYDPLYVDLIQTIDDHNSNYRNLKLHFYENRNRVNAIASPKIKFYLEITSHGDNDRTGTSGVSKDTIVYQNAGSEIEMKLSPYCVYWRYGGHWIGGREKEWVGGVEIRRSARLLPGPGYEIIGDNPTKK